MVEHIIISNAFGSVTDDPDVGLNMNVKLRTGGRKAPVGGKEKLQKLMNEDFDIYEDLPESIFNDVKYGIDTENFTFIPKVYTTANGVDYLMAFAGGDWQSPAMMFLYWDGKRYRIYVPLKGNRINPETKMAFGEEQEYACIKNMSDDETEACCDRAGNLYETPINIPACIEDFESRLS